MTTRFRGFRVRITHTGGARAAKKAMGRFTKEGLRVAAEHWRDNMLERHFTAEGGRSYNYKAREKRYRARKKRLKGHSKPLVYTGETKRKAMAGVKISSTSKQGRAVFRSLPRHFYATRSDTIDLPFELTRINRRELRELGIVVRDEILKQVEENPETEVVQ